MIDNREAFRIIDDLLEGKEVNYEDRKFGVGRRVFIFKDFVIKYPKNEGEHYTGDRQNENERFIYLNTRHPRLNNVYFEYRGCLICKKVETDTDVLFTLAGVKDGEEFEQEMKNRYHKELANLIKAYDLREDEVFKFDNWGYDYKEKEFVCVDYGVRGKRAG